MVRKIIRYPSPSLRSACKPIDFAAARAWDGGEALAEHLRDLRDTLAAEPHGLALASNQIEPLGFCAFVARPGLRVPRVAAMMPGDPDGMMGFPEVCINPSWEPYPPHEADLVGTDPEALVEHARFSEGCLSVPEGSARLHSRHYWVQLHYWDEEGRECMYVGRGLAARIVQHECDHLAGRLIVDLMDKKTHMRVRAEAIKNRKAGR